MQQRLLVYYPSNKRSESIKAQIDILSMLGLLVYVLTQEPEGVFHNQVRSNPKVKVFAPLHFPRTGARLYHQQAKFLVRFCKANKINIIFSHLQVANLSVLLASAFLVDVRIYYFRHHFQYFKKFKLPYLRPNRNEQIGEFILNLFAKRIVVPSTTVREGMINYEKVAPGKISVIPYVYPFRKWKQADSCRVQYLKQQYPYHLRLMMCSRFVEGKRHALVLQVIKDLLEEGFDLCLILIDKGPLETAAQHWVAANGLSSHVHFLGYVDDIENYYAACDLMIHPSLTEASNSSVKEMALAERTAVVCRGVGDFDDYIISGENGFLVPPLDTAGSIKEVIRQCYYNKTLLYDMGVKLRKAVIDRFSEGQHAMRLYKDLLIR